MPCSVYICVYSHERRDKKEEGGREGDRKDDKN